MTRVVSPTSGSIASKNLEEEYTLDQLNKWAEYYQDLNGDGTPDLEQTRVHNAVNEITSIGATTRTNWADPAYDAAVVFSAKGHVSQAERSDAELYTAMGCLESAGEGARWVEHPGAGSGD